jgi:hypothetical protein
MPISLTQIATNTATTTFYYGENRDSITITFYPGKVTERTVATLNQFAKMTGDSLAESFAGLNSMLANLIKSWDVYEDESRSVIFPIIPDRLSELPIDFRSQVIQAIMRALRPEATTPQTMN